VSDECVGVGQCIAIAPSVFERNDSGYSIAPFGAVPDNHRAQVLRAVASCPTGAIEIVD